MSIEKNLVIRIGADVYDLTAGFAKIGDSLKWLTGKLSDLAAYTKDGLISGAALAESTAGLTALSAKYGMVADEALRAFDRVTDGQFGLMDSTQKLSQSLSRGFSPEQTATIWSFANKYADVVGGSMEDVANRIEIAITKGRVKTLAEFGIMAKTGGEALEMLKVKTAELGEGVFSFGDSWKQITNSVEDMRLAVFEQLNRIVGEKGFGEFSQKIRDGFWEIKKEAGAVAAGMFAVAETLIKPVYDMVADLFKFVTGGIVDSSDSWRDAIYKISRFIVSSVYDVEAVIMGAISNLTYPIVKLGEKIAAVYSVVLPQNLGSDFYGRLSDNLAQFSNIQEVIAGRKAEQLTAFDKSYTEALNATKTQQQIKAPFFGEYEGDMIGGSGSAMSPATAGKSFSEQKAVVINVPRGDKIGEAIRDWLTVDAMGEGVMRAGM